MMVNFVRTNAENKDFIELVTQLDKLLSISDGKDHAFYAQYNKLEMLNHVIVAYQNGHAVGCGAVKPFDDNNMEVKRMFVIEEARGQGIAEIILKALETWTNELGYQKCILETGIKLKSAIRLYEKSGYSRMTNYGQYSGVKTSICFTKSF